MFTNQAEMDIMHKFKYNFSVQKDQCANILHGLQNMGIQYALMYNIAKLFQIFYQESDHFILNTYLLELLMIFHKVDCFQWEA